MAIAVGALLGMLLKRQANEATRLRTEIEVGSPSKVAREQKGVLNAGFDVLLSKLKPVE